MRRPGFLLSLAILLLIVQVPLRAQHASPEAYGQAISDAELRRNLTILASDFMEGRETGKRGQRMAASFIRAHFQDLKLHAPVGGDYLQPLELYRITQGESYAITASGKRLDHLSDIAVSGTDDSGGLVTASLVFVGDGSEEVYKQVDVKGKAVLLLSKSKSVWSNQEVARAREQGAKMVFVCNSDNAEDFARSKETIRNMALRGRLVLD